MNRTHLFAAGPELDSDLRAFRPDRHKGRLHTLYGGGGSSSQKNYKGLEELYQEQAASARLLRNQAEQYLPEATSSYVGKVREVTDPAYADKQASMAGTDMASANAMERDATTRELQSMGVNPNDSRFAGSLRGVQMNNAARMAAGKNIARNDAKKYQLAVSQDAVGTFTGQSNSAAAQASSASSGMSNLVAQKQQAQNNAQAAQQQNTANAVGGAMAAWSLFKDGGRVFRPGGVKMIERHMLGGAAGAQQKTQQGFFPISNITPQPQQAQMAKPQQQGPSPMQMASTAKKLKSGPSMAERGAENTDKMARIADKIGAEDSARQLQSQANGMRMSAEQTEAAASAYEKAAANASGPEQQEMLQIAADMRSGAGLEGTAAAAAPEQVVGAVPEVITASGAEVAGAAGADALGAAGAETLAADMATSTIAGETLGATTAATGATAGSLGTAGAAISTAMPWVGAAIAVGSLLGAFKDGGEVDGNPTQDMRDGDEVEGPGDHTADIVPALLSNDEHVLNAESSAMVGHDKLEKINEEGLRMRRRGLTPQKIRGLGIKLNLKEVV